MGRGPWLAVAMLLLVGELGCSSTRLGRPKVAPGVRTITSVGDSPASVVAGMPGASASSGPLIVSNPVGRDGRIHGRVVDERGRPIPDVEVRVADGGALTGRDLSTFSDDAGGFTLRGLRPDETYTLVASREGARGGLYGRQRVAAPDGGVEIVMRSPESAVAARRASRPRAEESEPAIKTVRAPRPVDDEPALDRSVVQRASATSIDPWRSTTDSQAPTSHSMPIDDMPETPPSRPHAASSLPFDDEEYEDDVNPLPPALERPVGGDRHFDNEAVTSDTPRPDTQRITPPSFESETFTSGDGPLVPSFPDPEAEAETRATNPPASPERFESEPPSIERHAVPESDAPPSVPPPSEEPTGPLAPGDLSDFKPVEPEPAAVPDHEPDPPATPSEHEPFESEPAPPSTARTDRPRATWNQLAASGEPSAPRPSPRPAPPLIYPRSVRRQPKPLPPAAVAASAPERHDPGVARTSVQYDNRTKRLVDFTLADLDGRPARFSDLDSDFILLDFWGTWCAPCAKTMPHLVELQEKYDPSRLRVVGIAYERGPLPQQVAAVRQVAGRLGVNYPILLGEQDGQPCPLLSALHVDQYPTLILLDRNGRILWRDSGSRAEMLQRLDRVIESNARYTLEKPRR